MPPAKFTVKLTALLRREGLYSSQLSSWRRERDKIAKVGMTFEKSKPEDEGKKILDVNGPRPRQKPVLQRRSWLAWRPCWRSKKGPPTYW